MEIKPSVDITELPKSHRKQIKGMNKYLTVSEVKGLFGFLSDNYWKLYDGFTPLQPRALYYPDLLKIYYVK